MQLEAQILQSMGPELDLEALERGDAEALAGENLGLFCFFTPQNWAPIHLHYADLVLLQLFRRW